MAPKQHFKEVIPKNETPVEVVLSTGKIVKGILFLDQRYRLFDFMNKPEPFLVLVDKKNNDRLTMVVNKAHIVSIRETELQKYFEGPGDRSLF